MAVTHPNVATRNALADYVCDQLDNGNIVYTVGAGGAIAATCAFGVDAFAAAVNGVATANAISPDTDAVGNASPVDYADLRTSGNAPIVRCQVSMVGGGGDIIMSSTTINPGDNVDTTALTYEAAK